MKRRIVGVAAFGVLAFGCSSTPKAPAPAATAAALLEPKSGSTVEGAAVFTEQADGRVALKLDVANAPPGKHAVHLHVNGDCSAPDGASAGGHWNPNGDAHGKWDHAPFHLGDIGNLEVGEDGKGSVTLTTDAWKISGEPNGVVGRSVVVHGGVDDFTSQPAGNAGNRIACGVVRPG
ncbi:MAG TPA: superoxide dismutase family protein [Myxococcaceae bacterium]|nr:superoxide dismutase family protein [Myxococcaceae bacterium]